VIRVYDEAGKVTETHEHKGEIRESRLVLRLYLKHRSQGGDNFGLWPQSARTPDALLCVQIKSCLPFSNSNPQFKTHRHNYDCDCPEPDEELGIRRGQS
jgi:hypothetical protein